jgi:hypothetical protein
MRMQFSKTRGGMSRPSERLRKKRPNNTTSPGMGTTQKEIQEITIKGSLA